jgi:hypothetical protein
MTEEATKTFADLAINQGRPSTEESNIEFDLPGGNIFRSAQNDLIGKDVPPGKVGIQLVYLSFSKVFVIWRPWESCSRCNEAIQDESNKIKLPDVGDYVCPHVQEADFKTIRDKCLSGEFLLDRQEFFNLRDGTRCVHISWLEADAEKLKQMEQLKKVREKMDNIYPHDPTKK